MDRALDQNRVLGPPAGPNQVTTTATSPAYMKYLFLAFLLSTPFVNPWVRGDGVGYYAYARSLLIDRDLNFENEYRNGNESFAMSRFDAQGRILPEMFTPTGRVGNHFTVGPAILWAPVLATVHLGVLAANQLGASVPADGNSRPYVLAMALATAGYGFLSLLLAFRIACRYFAPQWAFLATIGIWTASSLPVYMYFNPSWSHALSAFGVSLFLWYWDGTRLKRTLWQWVILGLIAGLMGNLYYPNAFLLVFPAAEIAYLLGSGSAGPARVAVSRGTLILRAGAFAAVFLVALIPTFMTRQIIYGSPFETGYPGVLTWNWSSPKLLEVLFSSNHGIWSWTPILFPAVIGLFFLIRRDALLGAGSLLTFLAYYYFISSYPSWDGLSSYGNRFFVSLTPIFILGLAALFNALPQWVGKTSRALLMAGTAVGLLVVWNAAFVFQWGVHLVPARGPISWSEMIHNQFVVVPARITRAVSAYFVDRSGMMNRIEKEDIEQQKSLPVRGR